MGRRKTHKPISNRELENLIKQSKNEKLERILKGTEPSDWVFDHGTTLLHLAVKHNNPDLLKYLLDNGYNVDAENSSGDTPLLSAIKSKNIKAIKILLNGNANVRTIDVVTGVNTLRLLIAEHRIRHGDSNKIVDEVVPYFMNNFKRRKIDVDTIVELLIAAECPLQWVLLVYDRRVTRKFLERRPTNNDCHLALQLSMEQCDIESIKMILHYCDESARSSFYQNLCILAMICNNFQSWKVCVENLSDWHDVVEKSIESLDFIYETTNWQYLQVLLDSKIHRQVEENFGMDLRTAVFANKKVNAIELFKYQDFNVNAKGYKEQTGLHRAVIAKLIDNVRLLLDSGVDVEIKDDEGKTALFDCTKKNNMEIGKLLLEHGVNVLAEDNNGRVIFEIALNDHSPLWEYLIARLTISHFQGVPMKETIQEQIDSSEDYTKIYHECYQQLEALNNYKVVNSITLFDVLTDKIERLCWYICNRDVLPVLDQYKEQHELHSLYYSTMRNKLISAIKLYNMKCDVADVICENKGFFSELDNQLVVRMILDYLSLKEVDNVKRAMCAKFL